jgi:hypothetical protein
VAFLKTIMRNNAGILTGSKKVKNGMELDNFSKANP